VGTVTRGQGEDAKGTGTGGHGDELEARRPGGSEALLTSSSQEWLKVCAKVVRKREGQGQAIAGCEKVQTGAELLCKSAKVSDD
jgi:hypothetical protein